MATTPTQIANLVLDQVGINFQLGDIAQGGREANVLLRSYGECVRQLLRACPWAFARKHTSLQLLADASGATPNVSAVLPGGYASSFCYSYARPIDCARVRYIPANQLSNPGTPFGNITPPNPTLPLLPSVGNIPYGQRIVPTRFLETNDPNFTAAPGSNGQFLEGQSPIGSTVLLSNVQNATCVYTFDCLYPSLWDHLFRGALVAFIAQDVAPALWASRDPKMGLQVRAQQIAITKLKVSEARVADGNEGTFNVDHIPDWLRFRNTGGGAYGYNLAGGAGNFGCWGGAWGGALGLADGSAY